MTARERGIDSKKECPNRAKYTSNNPTDGRDDAEGPTHCYALQGCKNATSSNISYSSLDSSCRRAYIFGV